MKVVIESPYSGDIKANEAYARKCLKDSLDKGESPLAFHLLYTQVLDDTKPEERQLGIQTSFEWHKDADLLAVYFDNGITTGMEWAISIAKTNNVKIEYRRLKG